MGQILETLYLGCAEVSTAAARPRPQLGRPRPTHARYRHGSYRATASVDSPLPRGAVGARVVAC